MFTLGIEDKKLLHRPKIPMLKERNARQGFFEADEFEAVCEHLPEDIRAVVTFGYCTGWRINSEVLPLEWRQVDFRAGVVCLERYTTKNDDGREFPFGAYPALRDLLQRQYELTRRLEKTRGEIIATVFHRNGQPIGSFYGAWRSACAKAGYPGRIPHDLRRTAVRNLVRAGCSELVAMELTGHKTRSVFDRYSISSGDDRRQAVEQLADAARVTLSVTPDRSGQIQPIRQSS